MKISCFTFIRNGTLLGYHFIESIVSALPLCDEFVIAVGDSEDDTLERIQAIQSDKIVIIQTHWNESMQDRGFVYAQQKMIAHYNCTGDWAFYLEGDEVLHEQDLPKIRLAMEQSFHNPEVEALAFDYYHFFGSPKAKLVNAPIYHYGHVRNIAAMREKNKRVGKYWQHDHPLFNGYQIDPQALSTFKGQHPAIVSTWLKTEAEQDFSPDISYQPNRREIKHRWAMKLERFLGVELSKKHFTLVK